MRNTLLAAVAAFLIGGATVGAVLSYAQPAPPSPPAAAGEPMTGSRPPMMGWMRHWRGHRPPIAPGTFSLIYTQADRNLAPPDVQKIAEAFLLWHGNHTWKVVNVAPSSDGTIGFSLATQDGSVISQFTMDPHTGRIRRVG